VIGKKTYQLKAHFLSKMGLFSKENSSMDNLMVMVNTNLKEGKAIKGIGKMTNLMEKVLSTEEKELSLKERS